MNKRLQITPRKIAVDVLLRVEKGAYSHIALKETFSAFSLTPLDRAFITELVYGTIRRKNTLDFIISGFLKQSNLQDEIRCILRMGVYQLRFMDRVPSSAAVNESVNLVDYYHLPGQKGFVNAVLRNIERNKDRDFFAAIQDPIRRLALVTSHPSWIVEKMLSRFGQDDTEALLDFNNRPSPNIVRVNSLKTNIEKLKLDLEAQNIQVSVLPIPGTLLLKGQSRFLNTEQYKQGHFMLQSPSSILAALMLQPHAGLKILDACAAPGGKSFVMAQEMNNQGALLSSDVHEHKLNLLKKGFAHLGIDHAKAQFIDWTLEHKEWDGYFDRVLVDAPCSGLGVLSKRADARWNKQPKEISELVLLQKSILGHAAQAVKKGGLLMYATCTLTIEENQAQREWFLSTFPQFSPAALMDISGAFVDDADSLARGELEILPFKHNLEGFYMALFERGDRI